MKIHAVLLLFVLCPFSLLFSQSQYLIKSPDGALVVDVSIDSDAGMSYKIRYEGQDVLGKSSLGLIRADGDFSFGMHVLSVSDTEPIEDRYVLENSKRYVNQYEANERKFKLENASGQKMDIVFQVSKHGVAFRYFFPEISTETKRIVNEVTSFKLHSGSKAFLQPMQNAKEGWSSIFPAYEENYLQGISIESPSPNKAGWVFPALFEVNKDVWVLLSETAPYGNYCGSRLGQISTNGEYRLEFPQYQERFLDGALEPESTLPWETPWRLIVVGKLSDIVESSLGTDLAKPSVIEDASSFVKLGKASWSWLMLKDDSTVFHVQKRFIDHAAAMNWDYCLIDADWDKRIGYEQLGELVSYGKKKGVGLIVWYNSSGPWNTTVYSPKSQLLTQIDREREFMLLRDIGIKGIKIDFFGGDGQSMMNYYTAILGDAAKFGLMVNFHGNTFTRGWQRTYPNLVTSEAVKGYEFVFDQAYADAVANHCAMLPFTRNVFDPMDFTPMSLDTIPGIKRHTTNGFELALPVLFQSGIQHFPELPEVLAKQPDFIKNFLTSLPVTWDDVRFIDGYPGKYVVLARKKGDRWYVAGINSEDNPLDITLDLAFLNKKSGFKISDGMAKFLFEKQEVRLENGFHRLTIQPSGGFVMVF